MAKLWQQLTHRLIDCHCHLHQYANSSELKQELLDASIRCHLMSVSPKDFSIIEKNFPEEQFIRHLGYFPLELSSATEVNIEEYFTLAQDYPYIGEVGLDYCEENESERQKQRNFLNRVIELNNQKPKLISLHSRRAVDELLDILENMTQGHALLHWLSATEEQIQRALQNPQIFFSINPAMTKSRQAKTWLKVLPKERVLCETDGPYIKMGQKEITPFDTKVVVEFFARAWGIEVEETLNIIEENHRKALKNIF